MTQAAEEPQKDERCEEKAVNDKGRPLWLLVLAYLGLAAAITWPAVLSPFESVPGADRTDLWNSLWSMWFVQDSAVSGVAPLDVPWLDWPHVGQIVVADPLNAILGIPLITVLGLSGAYTAIVLAHIAFTGVSAHLLARYIYGGDSSGWIGGVGFATAPVLISGVQNGTSESFAGGWLALSLYAVILAVKHGGARRILTAAISLCVVCIGGWYTGVGAWMFLAAMAAFWGPRVSRLACIKRAALVGLLALSVVGPIASVTMVTAESGNEIGIKNDRELLLVRRTTGSADPFGWVMPGDWRSPDFRAVSRDGEQFIHCHYLGWALLILAVAGARRRSKVQLPLFVAGAAGAVLAMGPVIVRNGQPFVFGDGLAIPLPYFLLEHLPGFGSLSLLFRLAVVPALALALLAAAVGVGKSGRFVAAVISAVLVEAWFVAPTAGLPDLQSSEVGEPIWALAGAPVGAVMNYPLAGGRPYLYEQTVHQKPIAGRLNFPNNRASMAIWQTLVSATEAGAVGVELIQAVREEAISSTQVQCGVELVESVGCEGELIQADGDGVCSCLTGVRYLVVHKDENVRPDMHDRAVENALSSFPVLSQSDRITVLSLW